MSHILPISFLETGVMSDNHFSYFRVILYYHHPNERGTSAKGLNEERAARLDQKANAKTLKWFSPQCSMDNGDCGILARLNASVMEMDEELKSEFDFYREFFGNSRIAQFHAALQLTDKPNSAPLSLQYTARKEGNRNHDLHSFLHFLSLAKGTRIDMIQVDSELPEQLWPIAYMAGEELRCGKCTLLGDHSSSSTSPLIQALLLPHVRATHVKFMTREGLDGSYEDYNDLFLTGKGTCAETVKMDMNFVDEAFFPGLVKAFLALKDTSAVIPHIDFPFNCEQKVNWSDMCSQGQFMEVVIDDKTATFKYRFINPNTSAVMTATIYCKNSQVEVAEDERDVGGLEFKTF